MSANISVQSSQEPSFASFAATISAREAAPKNDSAPLKPGAVRGDHRAVALHALVSQAIAHRNGVVSSGVIGNLLRQAGLHRQSWRNEIEALGFWIEWSATQFDVRSQPPRCIADLVLHVSGTVQSRPNSGEPGFTHVADIVTKHCRDVILPAIRIALRVSGPDEKLFAHLTEIGILRSKSNGSLIGLGKLGSEMIASGLPLSSAVTESADSASTNVAADSALTRVISSKALASSALRPPASTLPASSEASALIASAATASAASAATAAVSSQRHADFDTDNSDRKLSAMNPASTVSADRHGFSQVAELSPRKSGFTLALSNRGTAFDLKVSSGTFGDIGDATPFPIEVAGDDSDSDGSTSASATSSISQSILGKRAQNEILAATSGAFKIVRNASDIDSTGMVIPTGSDEGKIRRIASNERNVWDSLLEADDESDQLCRGWGGARSSQSASDICVSVASLSAPLTSQSDSSGTRTCLVDFSIFLSFYVSFLCVVALYT
jgi:hypothetical protein